MEEAIIANYLAEEATKNKLAVGLLFLGLESMQLLSS
jgi:hypothetical protein